MSESPPDRRSMFRQAIENFIRERLEGKLENLAPDDPKRDALIAQYQPETWIDHAARRVAQIQVVTHTLKPIHPDARGTNLFCPPQTIPQRTEVGSHCLGADVADDVVGNAAALDVYKFLKLDVEGRSLLQWMLQDEPTLSEALSPDPGQARTWLQAFKGITHPSSSTPASHTLGKQLFWLTGEDPLADDHYHLIAPLYASSLAHTVYHTIEEHRFGEAGKEARQARRDGLDHPAGFHEYPNLAVQKLGGTNSQNISQLNAERRGNNYLLASLPPHWKSQAVKQPWRIKSVFPRRYGLREDVRDLVAQLRRFLLTRPEPNMHTRNRVERNLDQLIDALVMFASELQHGLPAGWSADDRCELVEAEQLWLDPGRAQADPAFQERWAWMDWPNEIGLRFGNWLNEQLGPELVLGDSEQRVWRDELLRDESEFGWAAKLHQQRRQLETPSYVPTRGAVS
jgi:CRISPR-associated protein Csy1